MSKILENLLNNNPNGSAGQSSQTPNNSQVNPENQEPNLMNILVSALTPLVPVFMAKLTGQKLPIANTAPNNDQNSLQQLTPVLQNMISTQNLLLQEIVLLKKNDQVFANNFQGLKLTHKTEQKQIEYNTQQNSENYE